MTREVGYQWSTEILASVIGGTASEKEAAWGHLIEALNEDP